MNELQVVVKQEVGKINWNFEELKTALATEMKKYTGIVFDDDSIADAKKTVACSKIYACTRRPDAGSVPERVRNLIE